MMGLMEVMNGIIDESNYNNDYCGCSEKLKHFTNVEARFIKDHYDLFMREFEGHFLDGFRLTGNANNPYSIVESYRYSTYEDGLEMYIIDYWDEYFPNYHFIGNQVKCDQGTLDILAEDKETKRPVIIELKLNDKLNRQLLDYATCYDDPILVGVNSRDNKKLDNVIYMNIQVDDARNPKIIDDTNYNKDYEYLYEELCSFLKEVSICYYCYESNFSLYRNVLSSESHRVVLFKAFLEGYKEVRNIVRRYLVYSCDWYDNYFKDIKKNIDIELPEYFKQISDFVLQSWIVFGDEKHDNIYEVVANNFKYRTICVSVDEFIKHTKENYNDVVILCSGLKSCGLYSEVNRISANVYQSDIIKEKMINDIEGYYTDKAILEKYFYGKQNTTKKDLSELSDIELEDMYFEDL